MSSLEVQGILFDLDGVLIDSTAGVARAWTQWAKLNSLDPAEVVHTAHGRRAIDTVHLVASFLNNPEAEVAELEKLEIQESHDVKVFDGAERLLKSLPARRWAIVTSGTRPLATHRLEVAGLPIPAHMVTANEVERGKPFPDPYLRGAELLGLEPDECCVIEDSPSGVQAALDAGMPVLALPTTYSAGELASATALLPNLAALQASMAGGSVRLQW